MWYVYILECSNKALYVGLTNDIGRRFSEHNTGIGGRYTSYSKPTEVLYQEEFKSRLKARNRESQIKRWSKAKKLALAQGNLNKLSSLSVSRD